MNGYWWFSKTPIAADWIIPKLRFGFRKDSISLTIFWRRKRIAFGKRRFEKSTSLDILTTTRKRGR